MFYHFITFLVLCLVTILGLQGCSSENFTEINTVTVIDGSVTEPVDEERPPEFFQSSNSIPEFIVDKFSSSNAGSPSSSSLNSTISSSSQLDSYSSSSSESTKIEILPPAGFYAPFTLNIPQTIDGGIVLCTFNGTEPDESSDIAPASMAITKTTVVRCSEFLDGAVINKSTQTYFINEKVNLPVVAISVAPTYFANYIAAPKCEPDPCYSANFWEDVEYPVHVEYFANGSSSFQKDFEIDAGISIMGGWSRNQIKKSVSISMRKEYQDGRIKYPLFDTRPTAKKFKAFNLRNNGNRFVSDYIEDPMAVSLLEGTHVDYQRSRQVVVFYNGTYYGIHDMREKLNEHFVETNYGIDSKGVDVIKHTNTDIKASGDSRDGYIQMLDFASYNDLSLSGNYTILGNLLDIASFADYMAAEIYYHNGDWPNNNLRAWHSAEQPWKFMAFDIDHGFDWEWTVSGFSQSTNMFNWIKRGGSGSCYDNSSSLCFHNLYVNLIKNEDFKRTFINRAAVIYSTFVNSAKVTAAVNSMVSTMPISEINRDMVKFPRDILWYRNSCRGGFEYDGSCLKSWAQDRDASVIAEFMNEFGLNLPVEISIISTGSGTILVDDIELPSKNYSGKFFEGHPMKLTTKENGGVFVMWEDGSTENPRFVIPTRGSAYGATFK